MPCGLYIDFMEILQWASRRRRMHAPLFLWWQLRRLPKTCGYTASIHPWIQVMILVTETNLRELLGTKSQKCKINLKCICHQSTPLRSVSGTRLTTLSLSAGRREQNWRKTSRRLWLCLAPRRCWRSLRSARRPPRLPRHSRSSLLLDVSLHASHPGPASVGEPMATSWRAKSLTSTWGRSVPRRASRPRASRHVLRQDVT